MVRLHVVRSTFSPWPERRRPAGRGGLTLLELVVVMGILAAVAAIVVPLLPNMLRRAHKATDATQSSELAKVVQECQAMTYSYPDRFDALVDSEGSFPSYLPAETPGSPFGGFVTTTAPSGVDMGKVADALNAVGIKNVQYLASDDEAASAAGFHPTRFPYATTTATPITDATKLVFLDKAAVAAATDSHLLASDFASDPNAQYVVFGVGPLCTLVGQFVQDAPTSVPQNKDVTPDTAYCHFGVIFKVAGKEVDSADGRAKFMCAVAMEDDELEATEKDTEGYYQVARGTE